MKDNLIKLGFLPCYRKVRDGHIEQKRSHVEICNYNSTLKPTEDCGGCRQWEEFIPEGAVMPCENCGALLIIVRAIKCPICKEAV